MTKKLLLIVPAILIFHSITGQVNSNEEATKSLQWIIANPQIDSIQNFEKVTISIFKWYALNYPQLEFRTTGIGEFMDSEYQSKFYREIVMIYNLSELDNQVNKKVSAEESAYLAIKNVLEFYKSLIKTDNAYKHPLLDEYVELLEKKLKKRVTRG